MSKVKIYIPFLLILFMGRCAPPSGPHKIIGGLDPSVAQKGGHIGYDEVRPIFANYCAACHPSRSGPDWLDFPQAKVYVRNGKLLERIVTQRSMPPPGSAQAATLSDQQRQIIGEWVKAGGPQHAEGNARSASPSPVDSSTPDSVVQQCLGCHGATGPESEAQPIIPRINGQNENYISAQLTGFKWRERIDPSQTMNEVAADLSDSDIQRVAHYFAGLAGLAPSSLAPAMDKVYLRGKDLAKQNCVSCHMNSEYNNGPTSHHLPILAGQSKKYLLNQLIYFRSGERKVPLMNQMVKDLNNQDLSALAVFFACER